MRRNGSLGQELVDLSGAFAVVGVRDQHLSHPLVLELSQLLEDGRGSVVRALDAIGRHRTYLLLSGLCERRTVPRLHLYYNFFQNKNQENFRKFSGFFRPAAPARELRSARLFTQSCRPYFDLQL
jgi:hypothetical protein